MDIGRERWKWTLVVILFVVFLILANHAYEAINSQEYYPPPDDYLKGDSYDLEHGSGPDADKPYNIPEEIPEPPEIEIPESQPPQELFPDGEVNWDDLKDPSQE